MKRWLFFMIMLGAVLSAAAADPEVTELKPDLYLITGVGGNVLFYITDAGVLLVDTGITLESGQTIKAIIESKTSQPVRTIVYTHYHGDHTQGAQVFKATATIVAHENTRAIMPNYAYWLRDVWLPDEIEKLEAKVKALTESGDASLAETQALLQARKERLATYDQVDIQMPSQTFRDTMSLSLGGKTVSLHFLGKGHSTGDALVFFEDEKVLHTGDLLFPEDCIPYVDAQVQGRVESYIKIFDAIPAFGAELIVPGHGDVIYSQPQYVRHVATARQYLSDLLQKVTDIMLPALQKGERPSLEAVAEQLDMSAYKDAPFFADMHPRNLEAVYKEVVVGKNLMIDKPFWYELELYRGSADSLHQLFEANLQKEDVIATPESRVLGLIGPHYQPYGNKPLAMAVKQLQGRPVKTVVILCNSHFMEFPGMAVDKVHAYRMPLGQVELDTVLAKKLVQSHDAILYDAYVHRLHEQISNVLPILQHALGNDFKIVPVLFGNSIITGEDINDDYLIMAASLFKLLGPDDLVFVSNDMSHFFPDEESYREMDRESLRLIGTGDIAGLEAHERYWAQQEAAKGTVFNCAIDGIKTLMALSAMYENHQTTVLDYAYRSRPQGNFVGVGSAVFEVGN